MLPVYPHKDIDRGVVTPPTHFTVKAAEILIDHEVTESDYHFHFPIIQVICGYYMCQRKFFLKKIS